MITALGNTALKTGSTCSFIPVIPINRGTLTPLSRWFLPCLTFARNVMQRSLFIEDFCQQPIVKLSAIYMAVKLLITFSLLQFNVRLVEHKSDSVTF